MSDAPITAASVRQDLLAEQDDLDTIVAPMAPDRWELITPSPGWTIGDQIGHLAYFDRAAAAAIVDLERFRTMRAELADHLADPAAADEATLSAARAMSPAALLEYWRVGRGELADAASTLADDTRIEWYGPSMGSKSFLTARLMEAWAHGQDIADALGVERAPTDRLRHIAQLGYITRGWTYANRGLEMPDGDVRVELTAPSGATWTWGPDDAHEHGDRIGPRLLPRDQPATQRGRHRPDRRRSCGPRLAGEGAAVRRTAHRSPITRRRHLQLKSSASRSPSRVPWHPCRYVTCGPSPRPISTLFSN